MNFHYKTRSGVPLGIIWAATASTSAACAGEKKANLSGCPDWTVCGADCRAARVPGECETSITVLNPETELTSNDRRQTSRFFMVVRLFMLPPKKSRMAHCAQASRHYCPADAVVLTNFCTCPLR